MDITNKTMKDFGMWILLTFVIYYVIALGVDREGSHTLGCLVLGAILALGFVLAF
jgi:hypothetical protein